MCRCTPNMRTPCCGKPECCAPGCPWHAKQAVTSALSEAAKMAASLGVKLPPISNIEQTARLMVLIAEDMQNVNQTGRTREMIQADAAIALYAVMIGAMQV